MAPKISVITPSSRGIKETSQLLRDFRNQTFRDFEHVIVRDGEPPQEIIDLIKQKGGSNTVFTSIEKDLGNMKEAPGTNPRNFGTKISQGEFLVFCDDDDRYRDTFLETLITGTKNNTITVVQMSCQQSRMYKDGDPDIIVLIPEIGLYVMLELPVP